jgi:hypothetical protein
MANSLQWFGGAAIILGAGLSTPAAAQSPPVYGFGATPCSTFLTDLRVHGETARAMYYSWAQGFITASNALLHGSADGLSMVTNLTSKISEDRQQALLEDLCRAKPEQDFSRAAMQLLDKIRLAEGLEPILKN